MTPEQMKELKSGDIVRGKLSGYAFVVTENEGDKIVAVRTMEIYNPNEWDLVSDTRKGQNMELKND